MTDTTRFRARLAEILQVDPPGLPGDTRLGPENWDSFAVLSTIALIDEEFQRTVPADELGACASVGDVLRLVERVVSA
jgi:acyl carrier protein